MHNIYTPTSSWKQFFKLPHHSGHSDSDPVLFELNDDTWYIN